MSYKTPGEAMVDLYKRFSSVDATPEESIVGFERLFSTGACCYKLSKLGVVTAYAAAADTDVARGDALLKAVSEYVAGDTIRCGAGTFTISRDIRMAEGMVIEGAGKYLTKIKIAQADALLDAAITAEEITAGIDEITVDDVTGFRAGQVINILPTAYDPTDVSESGGPANYCDYDKAVIESVNAATKKLKLTANLEFAAGYAKTDTRVITCFNGFELATPVPGTGDTMPVSVNDVTIRNLEIDGDAANVRVCDWDDYQNNIHATTSERVTIENVYSHDSPFGCVMFSHGASTYDVTLNDDDTITLTDGSAHNLRLNDPVQFTAAGGLAANTIYYVCLVSSTTVFKVSATRGSSSAVNLSAATSTMIVDVGTRYVRLLNCDLGDQRYRGTVHFHGTQNFFIDACFINSSKDNKFAAIYGIGAPNCPLENITIQNCDITGAHQGVCMSGRHIGIRGNTIHGTVKEGIQIYDAYNITGGDAGHGSYDVVIAGNTIDSPTSQLSGIYIYKLYTTALLDRIAITGNTINGWYYGIRDEGKNTVISGNRINPVVQSGIRTFAPNSSITGNVIGSANRRAIELMALALNVNIGSNVMLCSGNTAVEVYAGASGFVHDNHVETTDDNPFLSHPIPCTPHVTTNRFSATAHNLAVNDAVKFGTTANGVSSETQYYVLAVPDANNFTVSESVGGAVVTLSDGAANTCWKSDMTKVFTYFGVNTQLDGTTQHLWGTTANTVTRTP